MFMIHFLSLIACVTLLASAGLLIWSLRNTGTGCFLGKIIGSFVLFLSVLTLLSNGYDSITYWKHSRPMDMGMPMGMGMSHHGMHHPGMHHQGMHHPGVPHPEMNPQGMLQPEMPPQGMMPPVMGNAMPNAANTAQATPEEEED